MQATFDRLNAQWAVTYTLTPAAAQAWDRMAERSFHQYVGIDIGGLVESAPIIQPAQVAFSSFGGKGEVSGSFTKDEAMRVAAALDYALAIPLVPART